MVPHGRLRDTAPLREPLDLAACVSAATTSCSDAPSADLFLRALDVYENGQVQSGADGILRVTDPGLGDGVPVEAAIGPVGHRFAAGHRLRLLVTSGAHPYYKLAGRLRALRAWRRLSGRGSTAVILCRPARITMVRYLRAVLTNFLIDQPVCASIHLVTARAEHDRQAGVDGVALAVVNRSGLRLLPGRSPQQPHGPQHQAT